MSFSPKEINIRLCFARFVLLALIGTGEYYAIMFILARELGCSLDDVFSCPPSPNLSGQDYFTPVCSPLHGNKLVKWGMSNATESIADLKQKTLHSCSDWGSIICTLRDCGAWLNNNTIGSTSDYKLMDRSWLIFLSVTVGLGMICAFYYLTKGVQFFHKPNNVDDAESGNSDHLHPDT